MEMIINYINKLYAYLIEKKEYKEEYFNSDLRISHTVCIKGIKFKNKCDECGSLSGRCLTINNNKNESK